MSDDGGFKPFSGTGRRLRDGKTMGPDLPKPPFRAFSGVGHTTGGRTETPEDREKKDLDDFFADDTHVPMPQNRPFRAFGGEGRVLQTGAVVPPQPPANTTGYGTFDTPSPSGRRSGVHTFSDIDNSNASKRITKISGNIHGFSDE